MSEVLSTRFKAHVWSSVRWLIMPSFSIRMTWYLPRRGCSRPSKRNRRMFSSSPAMVNGSALCQPYWLEMHSRRFRPVRETASPPVVIVQEKVTSLPIRTSFGVNLAINHQFIGLVLNVLSR